MRGPSLRARGSRTCHEAIAPRRGDLGRHRQSMPQGIGRRPRGRRVAGQGRGRGRLPSRGNQRQSKQASRSLPPEETMWHEVLRQRALSCSLCSNHWMLGDIKRITIVLLMRKNRLAASTCSGERPNRSVAHAADHDLGMHRRGTIRRRSLSETGLRIAGVDALRAEIIGEECSQPGLADAESGPQVPS